MSERFHIIITGDSGRSTSLQVSKKKFYFTTAFTLSFIIAICVLSYFTTGSFFSEQLLSKKVDELQIKLDQSEKALGEYISEIAQLKQQHDQNIADLEYERKTLIANQKAEIAQLKQQHGQEIADLEYESKTLLANKKAEIAQLKQQHGQEIADLEFKHERLLADQKVEFDLKNTTLQLDNIKIVSSAVNDLNERSELIESVMDTIGIQLKRKKAQENSGGPFIPAKELSYDNLLRQVDDYLETIRAIPLGKPVGGKISSSFGKRTDPVNKKKGFHEGVDIKGKKGAKIRATASGKVIKAFKNGGYGNYVEIDHGNGYVTAFGHMQSYLVKKGEVIEQGQVIGQVGSSGRSTGPHLHYEILLNKKPIDPTKFMKVAGMSHTFSGGQE